VLAADFKRTEILGRGLAGIERLKIRWSLALENWTFIPA